MFIKSGQNFDKVAGAMTIIELSGQNFVPRVLARTRTARQRKQICAIAHSARRAALHSTRADLLHRHDGEHGAKSIDSATFQVHADILNKYTTECAKKGDARALEQVRGLDGC